MAQPTDRNGNYTKECAAYVNGELLRLGKHAYGDAWSLKGGDLLYSGYLDIPSGLKSTLDILKLHYNASDNFYKNFNSKTLDPNHMYTVNMYYSTSPKMQEAYNSKSKTPGTHTGYLVYNGKEWVVKHNIHGTVITDPFTKILGSNKAYGITAIRDFGEKGQDNRNIILLGMDWVGSFFRAEGGKLSFKQKDYETSNYNIFNFINDNSIYPKRSSNFNI